MIQLFMLGGPTHLDTFDPKPEAGSDYCGPLKSPIATNVPGIRIGELLPLTAKQADKYSILRSFNHQDFGHETAAYTVATGALPARRDGLSVDGSRGLLEEGLRCRLPGWPAAVHHLDQSSSLVLRHWVSGNQVSDFRTGGDPNDNGFRVQGLAMAGGLTDKRLEDRRTLL